MVNVNFIYTLDTGQEMAVAAEVGSNPQVDGHSYAYVSWDSWKIDGQEVLDTDAISDLDKEKIYQQIMDEYDDITHNN